MDDPKSQYPKSFKSFLPLLPNYFQKLSNIGQQSLPERI